MWSAKRLQGGRTDGHPPTQQYQSSYNDMYRRVFRLWGSSSSSCNHHNFYCWRNDSRPQLSLYPVMIWYFDFFLFLIFLLLVAAGWLSAKVVKVIAFYFVASLAWTNTRTRGYQSIYGFMSTKRPLRLLIPSVRWSVLLPSVNGNMFQ